MKNADASELPSTALAHGASARGSSWATHAELVALKKTSAALAAIQSDSAGVLIALLAAGLSPDASGKDGDPLVCHASKDGARACLKALLDAGANPDQQGIARLTPLQWAAMHTRADCLELLIERGADVSIKSNHGWTAAMWSVSLGADSASEMFRCVELLRRAGASFDEKNAKGASARSMAQGAEAAALRAVEESLEFEQSSRSGAPAKKTRI
jgi:ankyrin repeat protein